MLLDFFFIWIRKQNTRKIPEDVNTSYKNSLNLSWQQEPAHWFAEQRTGFYVIGISAVTELITNFNNKTFQD